MGQMSLSLTDAKVRALKPEEKRYTINDTRGLHLEVMPSGRKVWRMRYTTPEGKKTWHTIGEYPAVTLAEAREMVPHLRERARSGVSLEAEEVEDMRFRIFAERWAADHDSRLSTEQGRAKIRQRMNNHIIPDLGEMIITEIKPKDVLFIITIICIVLVLMYNAVCMTKTHHGGVTWNGQKSW